MSCSLLGKATVVAVVVAFLAATAGASSFVSTAHLPTDVLSSTSFLWITANVIIVCLFVFSHRQRTGPAASSSSGGDLSDAMYALFPSSDHDAFAAAPDAVSAPVLVSARQPREARTAKRPTERPRVRRKSAGEDKPPAAVEAVVKPGVKNEHIEEEKPIAAAAAAAATASEPADTDDVSMDSAWLSIVRSGAARPVAVRKSETWGGEELPRKQRAADKAVAVSARREMRKSASMVPPSPPHPSAASATSSPVAAKQGWRTRDVLVVMAHDELLHRAESFIRRQHEHLRIQRQESDQRQMAIDQQDRRLRAPAPIRV
ncbi:uncharacterized protein LOC124650343 [Lolium rigidum]|uniref:uncharacterized protein LOC124650343 n=1 Tax=Lolium rigidum TaxID=89674 RepID=UPI001F5DDFEF|nr:uncharacterized protein LOC124650343 [Lolium rigidum]